MAGVQYCMWHDLAQETALLFAI